MNSLFRLAIAGGGTGGHVSPVVAVVDYLRGPASPLASPPECLWLGTAASVEEAAARQLGIPFVVVPAGKLRRYLSLQNVVDALRLPFAVLAARRQLARYRPTVLFSSGGFVSVPAVMAARTLGVPCLTHEQTVTVGLANRLNARFADRVALSYRASRAWLPRHPLLDGSASTVIDATSRWPWPPASLVVTGNPVRPALLNGDARRARQHFGLPESGAVVYITGGARGSHAINIAVEAILPSLLQLAAVIHQTGPAEANGDLPRLERRVGDLPPALAARYRPVATVRSELADVYALAQLVLGRAGAGTVAELAALGKPSLLIPLPGASADEQTRNALLLVEAGGAVLLPESVATPERLLSEIAALLHDSGRLQAMGSAARQIARPDAASQLVDQLLTVARSPSAHTRGR